LINGPNLPFAIQKTVWPMPFVSSPQEHRADVTVFFPPEWWLENTFSVRGGGFHEDLFAARRFPSVGTVKDLFVPCPLPPQKKFLTRVISLFLTLVRETKMFRALLLRLSCQVEVSLSTQVSHLKVPHSLHFPTFFCRANRSSSRHSFPSLLPPIVCQARDLAPDPRFLFDKGQKPPLHFSVMCDLGA